MIGKNQLEKVSDIFIQDLSFFGYRAPTIAWIGLGTCFVGLLLAGVYIVGSNNQHRLAGTPTRHRAAVAGVRG